METYSIVVEQLKEDRKLRLENKRLKEYIKDIKKQLEELSKFVGGAL